MVSKIIKFNACGDAEEKQDQRYRERQDEADQMICWKEWLAMSSTKLLGKGRQCQSAITQVLEAFFDCPKTRRMPVTIRKQGAMLTAIVETPPDKDIPIGGIVFPPCVPVSGSIVKETKNPDAVRITVTFQKLAEDATRCTQKKPPRHHSTVGIRTTTFLRQSGTKDSRDGRRRSQVDGKRELGSGVAHAANDS